MEKTEVNPALVELRSKFGKVREFIIPADEDDETKVITLYLKPCDRKTETMIQKTAKTSPERALIAGLKALWLGGDNVELLNGNDYAMRAAEAGLVEYMAPAKVEIKKN